MLAGANFFYIFLFLFVKRHAETPSHSKTAFGHKQRGQIIEREKGFINIMVKKKTVNLIFKKKMSGKSFKLSKKIIYNTLTYIWQKYILK